MENLWVVGDKVLIRPKEAGIKTKSGLYLPPGVNEKEKVHQGYVLKVGPGYAVSSSDDDLWKGQETRVQYIPLQAQEGDLAIFLASHAIEVEYQDEKLYIVPHQAILMLEHEETYD